MEENPMNRLYILALKDDCSRDFRWQLYYDCGGGFIGLYDEKNEYNVWSTQVKYSLAEIIKDAEIANDFIRKNLDIFKSDINSIDKELERIKNSNTPASLKDYIDFERKSKCLHEWVDEEIKRKRDE